MKYWISRLRPIEESISDGDIKNADVSKNRFTCFESTQDGVYNYKVYDSSLSQLEVNAGGEFCSLPIPSKNQVQKAHSE